MFSITLVPKTRYKYIHVVQKRPSKVYSRCFRINSSKFKLICLFSILVKMECKMTIVQLQLNDNWGLKTNEIFFLFTKYTKNDRTNLSQIIQMKHELMKWERNVDKVWTHNVICINVCTFKICKCLHDDMKVKGPYG